MKYQAYITVEKEHHCSVLQCYFILGVHFVYYYYY